MIVAYVITSLRDGVMSSTVVQGEKVTAHNTSHPAEPHHLECEDCDLLWVESREHHSEIHLPSFIADTIYVITYKQ